MDGFVKVGGMVNEDEHSEVEMRCRTQQGSECLGKGRGSHDGQKHFEKAERKFLRACVTQACLICIWRQWR